MDIVQPIRDINKINAIKEILLNDKNNGTRNHLLFVLGINSGLRISDLLNLKISDILDNNNKIKSFITLREQKTGKPKLFPINTNTNKAIKLYLKNIELNNLDTPLFASRKGNKPISRIQAWTILNNVSKQVGIVEEIGTHSLRKTFGYHAFKSGIGIETLQKILNHSSPAITLRYIGITQDDINNVYLHLNL